jgi:hypothetical protein
VGYPVYRIILDPDFTLNKFETADEVNFYGNVISTYAKALCYNPL